MDPDYSWSNGLPRPGHCRNETADSASRDERSAETERSSSTDRSSSPQAVSVTDSVSAAQDHARSSSPTGNQPFVFATVSLANHLLDDDFWRNLTLRNSSDHQIYHYRIPTTLTVGDFAEYFLGVGAERLFFVAPGLDDMVASLDDFEPEHSLLGAMEETYQLFTEGAGTQGEVRVQIVWM